MPRSQSRLLDGLTPTERWQPQPGLVLSAQLGSLAATGCIVWLLAVRSRPHVHSLPGAVTQSVVVGLVAFVCSGMFMTAFQLATARSLGFDALRTSLPTARTAVWLAPTAILLTRSSPFAVGAALALVIGTTKMLYFQWAEFESVGGPLPGRSNRWLRTSAYGVALAGQTTIVCLWMGSPLLAAALLCVSAAGLTLMCLVADAYRAREPSTLPDSLLRILFTLILGVGLTVGGRIGGFGSSSETSGEPDDRARPELITKLYQPSGSSEVSDKSYQGVILWPEVKATQRLVAPPPVRQLGSFSAAVRTPFQIPFSGQYWMFKPPLAAPPRGSYFRRTSPLNLAFLTTDQRPMSMKALQKLDHPVDLACCSAIQVAISNADRYPGTIALELLLVDTQASGPLFQSLGQRDVLSRPNVKRSELAVIPVTEVLEFSVPRGTRIRQFDGIQVLFHRAFFRADRSARISIEHFILVPP
jgi:hypothetical protein